MRDFGGMVSFLAESEEEAVAFCARTKLFQLAESLGGVESLIEHPARMTHASTADAPFAAPRNLVRLSVGIEAIDDLVADLESGARQIWIACDRLSSPKRTSACGRRADQRISAVCRQWPRNTSSGALGFHPRISWTRAAVSSTWSEITRSRLLQ